MTQYHAHKNTDSLSVKTYPLVLDVQSKLLDGFATRVVLPMRLVNQYAAKPITGLNPVINIDEQNYLVLAQQITVMPARFLGNAVADLSAHQHAIVAAMDYVLSGV